MYVVHGDELKEILMNSELLIAIVGVGGTLLGVVLGWLLQKLSNYKGVKLDITLEKFNIGKGTGYGTVNESPTPPEDIFFRLRLLFFNPSDIGKVVNNPRIVFYKNLKKKAQFNYSFSRGEKYYDYLNLLPNQIDHYYINSIKNISENNKINNLQDSNKVMLIYDDGKKTLGKKKKLIARFKTLEELCKMSKNK